MSRENDNPGLLLRMRDPDRIFLLALVSYRVLSEVSLKST